MGPKPYNLTHFPAKFPDNVICWAANPKPLWSLSYTKSDPPNCNSTLDLASPLNLAETATVAHAFSKEAKSVHFYRSANKKDVVKKNNKERKEEIKTVPLAQLPARRSTVCYIAYNAVFYPASSSQGPVNRTLFQNLPPLPVVCAMYWHCSAGLSKKLV